MSVIYPLVICGGNGTRLWPVSRKQSPKQFQRVGPANSLTFFQAAMQRHRVPAFGRPCVVSSIDHAGTVASQLAQIQCDAQVIHEPMGRNTGPAVLAAALQLLTQDPAALMLVVPADHVIEGDLNKTILDMAEAAKRGHIITFGITPRYAETGFGYITDGGTTDIPGLHIVDRFVEKPPKPEAQALVDSGTAYWASGLSMFAAATIVEEYRRFDPETVLAVEQALLRAVPVATGLVLEAESFGRATSAPTESMVFEKTERIALAPLNVSWSDVGSWTAMYGISPANADGNVLQGDVVAVDTNNSMVRSSDRLVTVVGMSDVIVIDTPDAVLVTRMGHDQNVKAVAEQLKAEKRPEVEKHTATAHAWGDFEQLIDKSCFNLSALNIKAGSSLEVDPMSAREAIVVKGNLHVSNAHMQTDVVEGGRILLDPHLRSKLTNRTDDPVEVMFLTIDPAGTARPDVPLARYA
ncbi:MAG: sugar phosphate nucleotidyltransferase [Pseudomonadota bacterium]